MEGMIGEIRFVEDHFEFDGESQVAEVSEPLGFFWCLNPATADTDGTGIRGGEELHSGPLAPLTSVSDDDIIRQPDDDFASFMTMAEDPV